ncbi:MAG: DUF6807 family protein [Rubripirellula sp.]
MNHPFRCLAGLSVFVLMAVPADGQQLEVEQTADLIVVSQDGQAVLTYNKRSPPLPEGIDSIYRRSGCLHPVRSPHGRAVTEMFPFDHPHQHGIYTAWVKTTFDGQPIDFWNLARKTGRVLHERVVKVFHEQDACGFEVDLLHRALSLEKPVDVLRERWRITVHATDGDFHCFDLETKQSALDDNSLRVEKHHYGGTALRGPTEWLAPNDPGIRERVDHVASPSGFLNDLGSDRINGNHQQANWVALWGEREGHPVSIAVLSHADNFRAPQTARLHPSKPYFCFAPCADDGFVIDREHPYVAKYRFIVTDAMPDPERLQKQWNDWCGQQQND